MSQTLPGLGVMFSTYKLRIEGIDYQPVGNDALAFVGLMLQSPAFELIAREECL